jgi:hypothetical protein
MIQFYIERKNWDSSVWSTLSDTGSYKEKMSLKGTVAWDDPIPIQNEIIRIVRFTRKLSQDRIKFALVGVFVEYNKLLLAY